ncbi:hypothetical protein niasHS_004648 [Heterodera schachtii]|uniref:Protein kinase domain-containing protein n=1 Tax=Heterodera schachtii TaxID=97005 RepID=A0ABD2K0S1_HETSC
MDPTLVEAEQSTELSQFIQSLYKRREFLQQQLKKKEEKNCHMETESTNVNHEDENENGQFEKIRQEIGSVIQLLRTMPHFEILQLSDEEFFLVCALTSSNSAVTAGLSNAGRRTLQHLSEHYANLLMHHLCTNYGNMAGTFRHPELVHLSESVTTEIPITEGSEDDKPMTKSVPIPINGTNDLADLKTKEIPITGDVDMKEPDEHQVADNQDQSPIGRNIRQLMMAELEETSAKDNQQKSGNNGKFLSKSNPSSKSFASHATNIGTTSTSMALSIKSPKVGSQNSSVAVPKASGQLALSKSTKSFRMTSRMPSLDNATSKKSLARMYSNQKAKKPPLPPLPPKPSPSASFRRNGPILGVNEASFRRNGPILGVNEGSLKGVGSFREQIEEQKKYLIPADRNSGPTNLAVDNPTKMITMLKQGNFLDLEPNPNAEELFYEMDLCNKFSIGEMKILRIQNSAQTKINEYYVFPGPISGGATSRVFHASPLNAVDIDGKPINQCVIIKSVMLELLPADVLEDLKREQQFLEVFRKIKHNRHIIHLFDEYEDKEKNRLIFVLERGEEDLMKRLQKLRQQWFNENTKLQVIEETIKQILFQVVAAVAEMHKTIIHLDLKSDNMLFVKKKEEEEMLKVIDFGGSEFIQENMESTLDEREVANVCKLRNTMWSDDRYSSPEQMKLCGKKKKKVEEGEEAEHIYPVSSKSDIWAIGMMLIEFLLMTPLFDIDPVVIKRSKDQKNIYNAVINLNRSYYDAELVQKPIETYKRYLKEIKRNFPKFYKIIKACLQIDPYRRPTARGIENFMKGECDFKWLTLKPCDEGAAVKN